MAGKSDIKKQILEIEDVEELNTSEENKSKFNIIIKMKIK